MSGARRAVALLTLAGLFISVYLYLFKIGKIGSLACGNGGCEEVQLSPQSRFLGVEVALIGVLGYALLLGLALLALQPRFAGPAWPSRAIAVFSGGAVLFSAYLTALELFVIHAICRYCVVSAVLIMLTFLLAVLDLRRSAVPAV